ncbi:hypothetical protein C1Y40_01126 [Mycobacterium talmoniae]|uniref:Uncharacterized protein n=1 Tax=Mycobacterium talmoniae TaxID=1858794 RepID=A0A2S8BPR6_9MYCO|nr:hypothetical protein C1Y40_01126 [Mycobacterium talmoniae]
MPKKFVPTNVAWVAWLAPSSANVGIPATAAV